MVLEAAAAYSVRVGSTALMGFRCSPCHIRSMLLELWSLNYTDPICFFTSNNPLLLFLLPLGAASR
jgi:hypothetical protein